MMWGYMPHVERYFPHDYYDKYGHIFGSIWVASAYKGAQGELTKVTKMEERLYNHLTWMQVMKDKSSKSILQFEGIALTGWSRYDHFLALCDLLPQAIPQLVASLQALKIEGDLKDSDKLEIEQKLGCNGVYIYKTFKFLIIVVFTHLINQLTKREFLTQTQPTRTWHVPFQDTKSMNWYYNLTQF